MLLVNDSERHDSAVRISSQNRACLLRPEAQASCRHVFSPRRVMDKVIAIVSMHTSSTVCCVDGGMLSTNFP